MHPGTTPTAPVATTAGRVSGTITDGISTFRGIPYAAAPTGDLRFAAPAPHPGWDGVRPATSNGPTPTLGPVADTHSVPEDPVMGAERLNLNVFTPSADPEARLPVYVWVHGGSYVAGAPGGGWFDGSSFARRGIVTVVITYRLGFEGFGYLPDAPANRGLLDQIAALGWVAQNIAAFGGDPDRVTVGGQSAGGGSVLALLSTGATVGLFSRAISHSAPIPDITLPAAQQVGAAMAAACGVGGTAAQWAQVPAERMVAAQRGLESTGLLEGLRDLYRLLAEREPVTLFGPVLGVDPLGEDILAGVAGPPGGDRPVLCGATSHEFNLAASQLPDLPRRLATLLLTGLGMPTVRARAYRAAFPGLSGPELVGQAVTDRLFRNAVVRVAGARAQTGAPTWVWDFRWRGGVPGLATHCMDLPFAWNTLGAERVERLLGAQPPQQLATEMHTAISAFITDGDPGWPPYTASQPVARVLDEVSWTGRDPYRFERIAVQT